MGGSWPASFFMSASHCSYDGGCEVGLSSKIRCGERGLMEHGTKWETGHETRVERGTRWTAIPQARVLETSRQRQEHTQEKRGKHTMRLIPKSERYDTVLERRQLKYIFESLLRNQDR